MSNTTDPGQWLGLLKWSLKYHDSTRPSEFKPLSKEDKAWLDKFLQSVLVDEVARMKEIVDHLEARAKQDEPLITDDEGVANLFEELIDITTHIDSARDLNKIQKFSVIVHMLRSPHPQFRKGACDVIATCTQNNPDMQSTALSFSVLEYLAHMVVFDPERSVRPKALTALSSVIRNHDLGERKFVEEGDGEMILARGIKDSSDSRMQKRCLFLMLHLVRSRLDFAAKVVQLGVATFLLEACSNGDFNDDLDLGEGIVQLLTAIATATPKCRHALLDKGAVPLLQQRLTALGCLTGDDAERAQEEASLITDLIHQLEGRQQAAQAPTTTAAGAAAVARASAAAAAASTPSPSMFSYTSDTPGSAAAAAAAAAASSAPPLFVPTNEWQPVLPGQSVPTGLHIKLDMQTGERMARIPDPSDTRDWTVAVAK